MSTPVTKTPEAPEKRNWFDGRIAKFAAFGGAIAFAVGSALNSIRNEFYDMMKHSEPFKQKRLDYLAREDELYSLNEAKIITPAERKAGQKINASQYEAQFDRYIERLGFETKGIEGLTKGTWQRFNELGVRKQNRIGLTFVGSCAVTLGGLMLMSQNTKLKNDLRNVDARIGDQMER